MNLPAVKSKLSGSCVAHPEEQLSRRRGGRMGGGRSTRTPERVGPRSGRSPRALMLCLCCQRLVARHAYTLHPPLPSISSPDRLVVPFSLSPLFSQVFYWLLNRATDHDPYTSPLNFCSAATTRCPPGRLTSRPLHGVRTSCRRLTFGGMAFVRPGLHRPCRTFCQMQRRQRPRHRGPAGWKSAPCTSQSRSSRPFAAATCQRCGTAPR